MHDSAYIKLSFHDGSLIAESGALEQTLIPVFIPLLVFCLQKKQQSVAQGHAVDTSGLNERPQDEFKIKLALKMYDSKVCSISQILKATGISKTTLL